MQAFTRERAGKVVSGPAPGGSSLRVRKLQEATGQARATSPCSRTYLGVQVQGAGCRVVQGGAGWCRVVQGGAGWCRV